MKDLSLLIMIKTFLTLALLLLTVTVVVRLAAQDPGGQPPVGPVHMTWDSGSYVGNTLHLSDVTMTSKDYDLQAATVVADTPAAGAGTKDQTFSKIVANGDPAKGTQVTGRFAAAKDGVTYLVRGDKAVYVPEPDRKNGGRIDFTGHVVVTVKMPKNLQSPALTYVEAFTVLVGPKPDYPKVLVGAGHADFTPLPQGK